LNPRLSAEFVEVMADMMAKEPVERIASAREVIARLAPFLAVPAPRPAEGPASSPPAIPDPVRSDPVKARWPPTVFVLVPLGLAGMGLLLWWLAKVVLLGR
jgi:hypothetical protein